MLHIYPSLFKTALNKASKNALMHPPVKIGNCYIADYITKSVCNTDIFSYNKGKSTSIVLNYYDIDDKKIKRANLNWHSTIGQFNCHLQLNYSPVYYQTIVSLTNLNFAKNLDKVYLLEKNIEKQVYMFETLNIEIKNGKKYVKKTISIDPTLKTENDEAVFYMEPLAESEINSWLESLDSVKISPN